MVNIKRYESFIHNQEYILYHATNRTWDKPKLSGLGFHAGTIKAAVDIISDYKYMINPTIKKVKFKFNNVVNLKSDYTFHNDLIGVVEKLYKDGIISKEDKNEYARLYTPDIDFNNLRKLLLEKYGIDGFEYINAIEDKGSNSYIALDVNNIEILDEYKFDYDLIDLDTNKKRYRIANKISEII